LTDMLVSSPLHGCAIRSTYSVIATIRPSERCRVGDAGALRELYPFGWAMQAQASLHGELLRRCGREWGDPALAGAGRAVEAVAHAWTGLRFTGAHGLDDPRGVSDDIAHHATVLRGTYARAVDAVGAAAARW
jgi:hypothetical protein